MNISLFMIFNNIITLCVHHYLYICTSIVSCTRVIEDIYFVVFFIKEKTAYSNNFNITFLSIFAIALKILKFTKK